MQPQEAMKLWVSKVNAALLKNDYRWTVFCFLNLCRKWSQDNLGKVNWATIVPILLFHAQRRLSQLNNGGFVLCSDPVMQPQRQCIATKRDDRVAVAN